MEGVGLGSKSYKVPRLGASAQMSAVVGVPEGEGPRRLGGEQDGRKLTVLERVRAEHTCRVTAAGPCQPLRSVCTWPRSGQVQNQCVNVFGSEWHPATN